MINLGRTQNNYTDNSSTVKPATNNRDRYNRYVGYNDIDSFNEILGQLYANTKKDGILIKSNILPPSTQETDKLNSITDIPTEFNKQNIYQILAKLIANNMINFSKFGNKLQIPEIVEVISMVLNDAKQKGALSSMLKSSFISFMCWFSRYSTYELTNILYFGTPTKNEIYWLYMVNRMGCNVNTISCIDDNQKYLKVDTQNKYSNLIMGSKFEPINVDFRTIDVDKYRYQDRVSQILSGNTNLKVVHCEMVSQNEVEKELSMLRDQRLGTSDGVTEPTYYVLLSGFDDEDAYRNMLFNIWKNITNSKKPLILIKDGLEKPNNDDVSIYRNFSRTDTDKMILSFIDTIKVPSSKERTILAKRSFYKLMNAKKSGISSNALFTMCINVCVWFKQCVELLDFNTCDIPVFFLYGNPNLQEYTLMELLNSIGFDILIACPDKQYTESIKKLDTSQSLQVFEYACTGNIKPFPEKLVRAKVATTAYNASKDLDHILYNDGCMFRDRHYSYCNTATLKTTYEEINLIWNAEAKYRPGFASDEHTVTVPNIFAKLNGVPNGDAPKYWKEVQNMITPNSVLYRLTPFFKPIYGINDFTGYFNGTRLDLASIKKNPNINKYAHLPDSVQDLIFQKMQDIIDSKYLKLPYPDVMHLTIKVGTMLPNDVLQLIQNYDFTKEVPKVVITHTNKTPFTAYECILLLLLNFIGFDILIYTPTGYKNIDAFIDIKAFEEYSIGEYIYDIVPPHSLKVPKNKGKLFGIFRKK